MIRPALFALLLLSGPALQAQSWQQQAHASAPPARYSHSMTWDSARARTVLFGGYEWNADRHFDDHWEHDGRSWTRLQLSITPPSRQKAGMCFDEARGVVVLFGGVRTATWGTTTFLGDTWEFDGQSWREIQFAGPRPSPRTGELCYDSSRGVVVLPGGMGATYPATDTWEYDGTRWTLRTLSTTPPPRADIELAFDRRRGVTVLHPGFTLGETGSGETWEYDGNHWVRSTAANTAPAFPTPAMTYDARRGVCVLVASPYVGVQETWEYDGASWSRRAGVTTGIVDLHGTRLAFDRRNAAVMLFGGERQRGPFLESHAETWRYGAFASLEILGNPCGLAGPLPVLRPTAGSLPRLDETLSLEVTNLGPGSYAWLLLGGDAASWNGISLPLDLAFAGLPGCLLLAPPEVAIGAPAVSGSARFSLPIPYDPVLREAAFLAQSLVASPTPSALTNTARLVIGL